MTRAATTAKERQLDWLLDEVLGDARRGGARVVTPRTRGRAARWLAAALIVVGVSVAVSVAWLRRAGDAASHTAQEPPAQDPPVQAPRIEWTEAHGPAALDSIPLECRNLRCFDFDDEALERLPKWTALERLDLGGMDVNDQGYAVSLPITDAGVAHLGALVNLRWLSLSGCHGVTGATLSVLENVPRLEHLDLSRTAVDSAALARLPRLPSLRELSLTWCMDFHGRSLADVARIAGLRRLELQGCVTVSAADAMHLAKARGLRHLDLRDCQGRFRGQTLSLGDEPDDPPVQDGVGITDPVVGALVELPLETLLLGGAESLTDDIGESLAAMRGLRELDLSNLPRTTGAILEHVPEHLTALALDHNPHWQVSAFATLPSLPDLREFGLAGLPQLTDEILGALLANKSLRVLRLGGSEPRGKGGKAGPRSVLTGGAGAIVADQRELVELDLRFGTWMTAGSMAAIAELPKLRVLDLTGPYGRPLQSADPLLPGLAASRSLESLNLRWRSIDAAAVAALKGVPLRELIVAGSDLTADEVRRIAAAWPGCAVTLPGGQRFRVP